jgi:hypothetical protein
MKFRLIVFVYPNERYRVIFIDFQKGFHLIFEETRGACGRKEDEAEVGRTLAAEALLSIGCICQLQEIYLLLICHSLV